MTRLTQSLEVFLANNYLSILPLVILGHEELITDEIWKEYIEWCQTDEGMQYLKGGSKYKGDEDK